MERLDYFKSLYQYVTNTIKGVLYLSNNNYAYKNIVYIYGEPIKKNYLSTNVREINESLFLHFITQKSQLYRPFSDILTFHNTFTYSQQQSFYDFFIDFFNQQSQNDKNLILNSLDEYLPLNRWDNNHSFFEYVFKAISKDYNELSHNIIILPKKTIHFNSQRLEEIGNLINHFNFPTEKTYQLLFKLSKKHKSSLSTPNVGPVFRELVFKHLGKNEETLKPFFPFSPFIANEFEPIDIDFIPLPEYSATLRLNLNTVAKQLSVDHNTKQDLMKDLKTFAQYLPQIMPNIQEVKAEQIQHIFEIITFSNTPFSNLDLQVLTKDFLLFKKSNNIQTIEATHIEQWFLNKELQQHIPNATHKSTLKRKI